MRNQKSVCPTAVFILTGLTFLSALSIAICLLFMVLPDAFIILLGLLVVSFFIEIIYIVIWHDNYQKKKLEEIKQQQKKLNEELFKMNVTCLTNHIKMLDNIEHLFDLLIEKEKKSK